MIRLIIKSRRLMVFMNSLNYDKYFFYFFYFLQQYCINVLVDALVWIMPRGIVRFMKMRFTF